MSVEIQVHADWHGLGDPRLMGILRATETRGKELFSFTYDDGWLASMPVAPLDPDLQWFGGAQYVKDDGRQNFGLFLDSCPDRWGRLLMRRREATLARLEQREFRRLGESDFLLGVHDQQRSGALRFRLGDEGNFLSDDSERTAPPWTSLRELEHASWEIQDLDRLPDVQTMEWLNLLIAPGSSIGGARPKAGVRDPDGDLWIAKFPGRNDDRDIGAWEWLTWQLAGEAGLEVPAAQMLKVTRNHHTFATRRFDRVAGSNGSRRLHFASAMTMLGRNDGADHSEGVSYLDLVEFITRHGADVASDLEELWRRIVFSICVRNTDDHLRNHGFMLCEQGWKLAPAYDINPDPDGRGLSLNITEDDNALDIELALQVAPYFQLKAPQTSKILDDVREAVSQWKRVATEIGLPRAEIENLRQTLSVS